MNVKTPAPKHQEDIETSAYRSYQRRENQRTSAEDLVNTDALERFTNVIELLHSNKITKMNAFDNRIMDQISTIFKSIENTTTNNETLWQRYSVGIDSCAKIYGLCVDFLHSETFKMIGGLKRTGIVEEEPEVAEDDGKAKKKKKFLEGVSTLETDEKAISTTKFEKYEKFDPYFKTISSRFDASTSAGLLLNNLSINGGLNIPFGDDEPLTNTTEPISRSKVTLDLNLNFTLESLENEDLFKNLINYTDDLNSNPLALSNVLTSMNEENELFQDQESEDSEVITDSEEENWNGKNTLLLDQESSEDESKLFQMPLQEKITNFAENDDYKFFSNPKLSAWGGFEFWKKTAEPIKKEKKQRRKKEETELVLDPYEVLDKAVIFAPPKKGYPNYYSDAVIKRWREQCTRAPEDYGFSLFRFTQLYTRPKTQVKCFKDLNNEIRNVVVEEGVKSCSDDENALFIEDPSEYLREKEEYPEVIATSKTVDIKKLKDTIWGKMQTESKKRKTEKTTFMEVINFLPGNLPEQEVKNLSIHSCFITMLHLANEHDLVIEKTGPCDFSIGEKSN